MPISPSDIGFMYSASTGPGGSHAGAAGSSLGGFVASNAVTTSGGGLQNLFLNISGANNAASAIDYQCMFVQNNNSSSITALTLVATLSGKSSPGALFAMAADTTAPSAIASSSAQSLTIANSSTAPAGITTWITGTNPLNLANLPAGQVLAVWFRRTAQNTAAINSDQVTFNLTFDTTA